MKKKLEEEKHGHKVLHSRMKRLTEEELCSRGWFFDIRWYEWKPVPRYLGMSFVFGHFWLLFLSM